MKCAQCGKDITGEENFCRNCGSPIKKEFLNEDLSKSSSSLILKDENVSSNSSEDTLKVNNNTNINLDNILKSNLEEKNIVYKIDNTQELLIDNVESSKKIKKILDELKLNKNEKDLSNDESDESKSELSSKNLKKEFEDNTKKIDDLIEKKQEHNNLDKKDSTIIVDSESLNIIKKENEETKDLINNPDHNDTSLNNITDKNISKEIKSDCFDDVYEDDNNDNSKKQKYLITLLLFIFSLCLIVYLIVYILGQDNKLKKLTNDYNTLEEKISSELVQNSNSNFSQNNINTNLFSYNGYNFQLYNNLKLNNNSISFEYKDLNLIFSISSELSFSDIKYSKDEYKQLLEKNRYKVFSYGLKVISEKEYVFFETIKDNKTNLLIVYTKGNQDDVFMFIIENNKNEIDYANLEQINEFINTLQKSENTLLTSGNYFIKK